MGSTTSPDRSPSPYQAAVTPTSATNAATSSSAAAATASYEDISPTELKTLLQVRDQEIQALKYELDKYKLALQQSQLNYHLMQQQLEKHQQHILATTNNTAAATSCVGGHSSNIDDSGVIRDEQETADDIMVVSSGRSSIQVSESTPIRTHSRSSKVLFKTGDDDSEDELSETRGINHDLSSSGKNNNLGSGAKLLSKSEETLEDIIHDVGEIDLDLELSKVASRRSSAGPRSQSVDGNEDELLTSLTDAAINNLSQLAALQEQCESQQLHSHEYQHETAASGAGGCGQASEPQPPSRQQSTHSSPYSANIAEQSTSAAASLVSTHDIANSMRLVDHRQSKTTIDFAQGPYSSVSSISSQAAIAISAAAAAATAAVSSSPSPMIVSSSSQSSQMQPHQLVAPSDSVSPDSTIQSDLTSTGHSLADVVAAAAVAAAAANDQQQQQQHSHLNPSNTNHHSQSRLVSSALASQDYYHNLHQQHQYHHQHHQHAHHHGSPLPSALTSLHYSPSASITPSPSSFIGSTPQSARRSTSSNASSNIASPTTLPCYLRRQFIPSADRLSSISPSSGLATGSSSGASSSLAQILHHHHTGQQRSASALAGGPISQASTSGTPLSASGSNAVSPMMSNKNLSQARLNNMQIRHKFGYLGSGKAQFNSPHGFCLGLNQEIVVADTNNHRVCIFDKSGTCITQFGSPGKEEGQLWNPRKVAILHRSTQSSAGASAGTSSGSNRNSGNSTIAFNQRLKASYPGTSSDQSSGQVVTLTNSEPLYVVCDRGAERSRMQLFTKDGSFIKKIAIHYIDIVAGLAITQNGLIIVVDSVSPTVYIIDGETGTLNGWFDCSGYMKEPSDIAVKSDVPGNEYFICDFKGHCVVVFSETGEYLRKIGHDGLTSYPNGIDISDDGDILVGDSHGNRFHVVVFDRNGEYTPYRTSSISDNQTNLTLMSLRNAGNFVSQFECPHVKVSRCCGLKITREGYIVTLAKNNHHVLVLDTIHI